MRITLSGILLISLLLGACREETMNRPSGPTWDDAALLDKHYDEVCFLMTHNAYNCPPRHTFPNQDTSISQQLKDGVRGLMLDVYDAPSGPVLYHAFSGLGQTPLSSVLGEIRDFLDDHPNAVISIIFENHGTHANLQNALAGHGLDTMTYTHDGSWPTLRELVNANDRLVLFVEEKRGSESREPWLHYAWEIVFDTPYSFNSVGEFSSGLNRGGGGSKELFLVNHWLSGALGLPDRNLADDANRRDVLSPRLRDCQVTQSHFINYVGVDFYNIGDALAVVDSINGF